MTRDIPDMTEALGSLLSARAWLEAQLAPHEAWRALCQLREREQRGEDLAALDGGPLRASLEQRLDRAVPYWRAIDDIERAMRLLTGIPSRPAAVEAPASPASERPVAPGSPRDVIRPRFKIKAGSSLVERVPRVVPSPTGPDGGVGRGAVAAPTTTLPPASGSETPANPVTGADSLQQRLKSAWPAPEEDAGPQPTSRAPRPETLLPPPAEPTSRPNPQDRLAAIEADLDTIMGLPSRSGTHEKGRSAPGSDDADAFDEAEVEIVPLRRELMEPELDSGGARAPGAVPSVALSIRLKQDERSAGFDSEDWAAYRTDVGEAEVEIVPGALVSAATAPDDGANGTASAPGAKRESGREVQRFLKALTGD